MTGPSPASNVIAFPQPSRQTGPRGQEPIGPTRQGGFTGMVASRLSQAGRLRFSAAIQRPNLPDGSVSPLF